MRRRPVPAAAVSGHKHKPVQREELLQIVRSVDGCRWTCEDGEPQRALLTAMRAWKPCPKMRGLWAVPYQVQPTGSLQSAKTCEARMAFTESVLVVPAVSASRQSRKLVRL